MIPMHKNPVVDFLTRLKALDKTGFTPRDVLIVYAIINKPGCSGVDVCNAIGVENHANIRCCLQRLQRNGLIEDRRVLSGRKAVPSVLVPMPKAYEFWESLKP